MTEMLNLSAEIFHIVRISCFYRQGEKQGCIHTLLRGKY